MQYIDQMIYGDGISRANMYRYSHPVEFPRYWPLVRRQINQKSRQAQQANFPTRRAGAGDGYVSPRQELRHVRDICSQVKCPGKLLGRVLQRAKVGVAASYHYGRLKISSWK
jgi:hypothetical protein